MRVLPAAGFRAMPWRNGGGITREIAAFPDKGDFAWRLSLATVASEGPFSIFRGIDRTLTVLEGAGIDLTVDGRAPERLLPGVPFAFAGDVPAAARLLGGTATDFNVMTRRGHLSHSVEARREGWAVAGSAGGAVLALDPLAVGGTALGRHDVVLLDPRERVAIGGSAAGFLLVTFEEWI